MADLTAAETDLLAKVRRARTLRRDALLAYDAAKAAREFHDELNAQAQAAEKLVEEAWRKIANPEIFETEESD